MKKYLVLLALALSFCFWVNTWGDYGEFGTSSTLKDTIPIFFQPWDSFGFAAPSDTLWIYRYVLADTGLFLIDSYVDTTIGNAGLGKYLWKRRAFDGTHYGSYRVSFKFRPFNQGIKYYTIDKFYTVVDYVDSVTIRRWIYDPDSTKYNNQGRNIDRIRVNGDKTGFYLAGTQVFNNTGAWTGNISGSVGSVGTTVQANLISEDSLLLAAIKAKTDKLIFDANDSLIIDYGRVPTGSGTDSATESRLIRRIVYGGVSNGSDSSTLAQRTVTLQSIANNTITASSINTGAFIAAKFAADYWALANWTGTWTQTQYSVAYWHNVALSSDSLTLVTMASLLGGKGNRMLDYYNASGKLDSARYYNNATLVSRLIFYRPTATSAPDSMKMFSY